MSKEKVLIIEDEADIRSLIKYNLNKAGFNRIETAESGLEGIEKAKEFLPDVILLDIMLPDVDGLNVCRKLRKGSKTNAIPIIMLTAKSEETDIIIGLEMGADDYITKPFSNKVLTARVRSVLRRHNEYNSSEKESETDNEDTQQKYIRRGDFTIDLNTREVTYKDQLVNLTYSEFEILYLLARRSGWVYSREKIVNAIKGDGYPVTERAIDVQIVGLRKKLGVAGSHIQTIRGVGYRFVE